VKQDQIVETASGGMDSAPSASAERPSAEATSGVAGLVPMNEAGTLDATIMMIDDATTTLMVLQAFLEDAGYRNFVSLSQPTEAFQLLVDDVPDVVLLDINMPEVSGFDILSFMRARESLEYTPVIVLTSSDDAETKLRALQLGATDFLAKPVDESELVLRLRNTLAAKRYLDQQTYYDRVTGLANRRLFMDRLGRAVSAAERSATHSAMLLINVDRFKKVNDGLGHSVGDELLHAIGRRLNGLVRAEDLVSSPERQTAPNLVARIGGDEFTVLLSDVRDVEAASSVAGRILLGLAKSFRVQGLELFVTASIGIAAFPEHGTDKEELLKHAGVAMSHAKRQGRNRYHAYSTVMDSSSRQRLTVESELHRALDRQELELHYQPKVDVQTGVVTGAETLVRWRHPERGLVPPGEFIGIAEDSGLIADIGDWVLWEACRQNAAWHAAGLPGLQLAVNVSGHQFRDKGLADRVRQALLETGLDPRCLTLELTEGVMIEDAKGNVAVLHELKEIGVTLSVDDFGTGYSSLSYLEQFPLDELKIDRSFVSKIDSTGSEAPIVTAIIAMAHSLNFSVVAEGVESEQQLSFLRQHRCECYQGYLFSKPVPAHDFAVLAGNWRPRR